MPKVGNPGNKSGSASSLGVYGGRSTLLMVVNRDCVGGVSRKWGVGGDVVAGGCGSERDLMERMG